MAPYLSVSEMKKHKAYILFGAPGCGKGTQGRALGALPGFFHCACGDVFRAVPPTTALGRRIAEFSSRGELVPDEITIQLWQDYLQNCALSCSFNPETDRLLLDGIPRNIAQARLLNRHVRIQAVINFQCASRSELLDRLRRRARREHRLDDAKEEVIMHRLDVFESSSLALLNYYRSRIIFTVNAQQKPTEVLFDILSHIQNL